MNNISPLLNRLLLTMTAGNCVNVSLFEYKPHVYTYRSVSERWPSITMLSSFSSSITISSTVVGLDS